MTTPPDRYTPRGEWNWNEWRREEPSKEELAACTILNEAVRQAERNMLLYGQAVVMVPKRQGKSLYMERLLDALHGRNITYVCSDKHEAANMKHAIEAVDAQIRKDLDV